MAAASTVAAGVPYGVITLDGIQYIERPQIFTLKLTVTEAYQVFTNQRLTLPGVANFLLKGLARDTTVPAREDTPPFPPITGPGAGEGLASGHRFRFRLNNAEASTWFFSGGLAILDDRVIDTLCFGSGQFPYPLIPPIPVGASGTLIFEVEDINMVPNDPYYYPYTVYFGFYGSYLIPAAQASDTQSVVYSVAPGKG